MATAAVTQDGFTTYKNIHEFLTQNPENRLDALFIVMAPDNDEYNSSFGESLLSKKWNQEEESLNKNMPKRFKYSRFRIIRTQILGKFQDQGTFFANIFYLNDTPPQAQATNRGGAAPTRNIGLCRETHNRESKLSFEARRLTPDELRACPLATARFHELTSHLCVYSRV